MPLPLDTAKTRLPLDTARTRALWASHFRMEKELLHNRFNIFLFKDDNKTTTNANRERKYRAIRQLRVHIQLANQFCQISHGLYTTLDSIRSKDADFTPCIHPLYGAVEILNGYYRDTSEFNEHLRTQWFGAKEDSELFQHWLDLRENVKRKAQSLEAFLSPDRPQLMVDDGKVPLESLFEMVIQCYLDCIPTLEPKQVGIGRVQELLRNSFPNLGKLIAAPTVIFLCWTAHGYHIGGNALHFSCEIQAPDGSGAMRIKDPFKMKKIYGDNRHSALEMIKGSSQVARRYDQIWRAMLPFSKADNQTKVAKLEEFVLGAQEPPLYLERQGQAMRVESFEPTCSCGKCYYTYCFAEASVEERDTTIYPKLACAEDMWALKAWLVDAKDGYKV